MEHRTLGSAAAVSAIGQGSWLLEQADHAASVRALRQGIDLGMSHLDTAEMYGSGAAEIRVGEAIAGRRDEVFLVSKVLPENASRHGTIAACEASLARLKTDRLDCYLLHWRGSHPLADTFAAFEELERAGKIRTWGVSNFDVPDLEEARRIAPAGRPACNQVLYHLGERSIEHAVLPWCERHHVAVVAYSPFGQRGGFPNPRSAAGRVLAEIAAMRGATPRQVALRFLLRRQRVFVIPKAVQPEHVSDNAGGGDLRLSAAELDRIDAAMPLGARAQSLPMI